MKRDAMDIIMQRRSIRAYKQAQITAEELNAVLEAGMYAPTGGGAQVPFIVAVQDPALVEKLVQMNKTVLGKDFNPYYGAPTIVLVFASPQTRITYVEDGSCVLTAMMYAAFATGLGSCWIHREQQMFETEEGKALMKEWGLPDHCVGIGALALGYAEGEHPEPAARKEGYVRIIK